VFVASEAVRAYSEGFKEGALELLLCTPLTVSEIIRGQCLNLFRYFRWPILVVLAANVFLLLAGRLSVRNNGYGETAQWFVAGAIFLMIDSLALAIVGLWHGLISRNSRQALTSAMVRILVLPWICFAAFNMFLSLVLRTNLATGVQLSLFALISLAINGLFAWRAWERLHQNLRLVAASRYGSVAPTFWARLGRAFGRLAFRRRAA